LLEIRYKKKASPGFIQENLPALQRHIIAALMPDTHIAIGYQKFSKFCPTKGDFDSISPTF